MFIIIVLALVILLIAGTSALGIFLSRKNKKIKNFTSKIPTLTFVAILSILAFFFELERSNKVAWSIGHTIGYVYIFSIIGGILGVLFMNKFKFNKKEFWTSWFFSLIWILVILIRQDIFKL